MIPHPSRERLAELAPGKGHTAISRAHWMPLMRRCHFDLVLFAIIMQIYDDTESWKPKRTWCDRSIEDFRRLTGASERKVQQALKKAAEFRWITREVPDNHTHRGRYQCHPENFAKSPLPSPRPCKVKSMPNQEAQIGPPTASATTLRQVAAFVYPHKGTEPKPSLAENIISPPRRVLHSDAESGGSEVPRSQAEPEPMAARSADVLRAHVAESGTVSCPIGLACPYSVNDLAAANQLTAPIIPEATCRQEAAGLLTSYGPDTVEDLRVGLTEIFPGLGIQREPVKGLDNFIASRIGVDYVREELLAYVRRRKALGPIGTGLIFHAERAFPIEFCDWWRAERAKQLNRAAEGAAINRRIEENRAAEERERDIRRRRLLDHPNECSRCRGNGWHYPTERHKVAKHKLPCDCPAGENFQNATET
jgi:hypothetical protein